MIGERMIRRKLKELNYRCLRVASATEQWAWVPEDDARERLRKLEQLDIDLLELSAAVGTAIAEVGILLELAHDDYSRELAANLERLSEAERVEADRIANVILLDERRAA